MRMVNNNRSIENTWSMLKFLYPELAGKRFKNIDITIAETTDDLYAIIISRWCASLAKEGLYKEYITVEDEEMSSPRGEVNIQQSIARQTLSTGSLVCSYDELSENIYLNHVVKGTLSYLRFGMETNEKCIHEIEKVLPLFNGVESVDIKYVKWKDIKYNNNNIRYKNLLEVCRNLVIEHTLIKSGEIDDNKRMYILFKKQLHKWIKQRYAEDKVEIFIQAFTMPELEPPFEVKLDRVQKLVVIKTEFMALLLCIRLKDEILIENNKTLPRKQINELVEYLREYKQIYKLDTCGCLVYINTDKRKLNLDPITMNSVHDYMIGEITIDIHDQWRFIVNKLDDIYKYFITRGKSIPSKKNK